MVLSAFFALLYGVFQIGLLGSASRSVAWQHALLAFAVGASAGPAMAIPAEYGAALLFTRGSTSFMQTVIADSYRLDPVIEEVCKLLPLALLLLIPRIRRSLGLTDIVVLSAAMGAGFAFTETALGQGINTAVAQWSNGLWLLPLNHFTSRAIPGPGVILTSWLPGTSGIASAFALVVIFPDFHLIWSALIGFGLALAAKSPKWRWLIIPLAIWVALDHATENAELSDIRWPVPLLQPLLHVTRKYDGLYVAVVLAVASVWDWFRLNRALSARPDILIAGERDARYGLATLALARWRDRRYLRALWAYVLERRAYLFAFAAGEAPSTLAVANTRVAACASRLDAFPTHESDANMDRKEQGQSKWALFWRRLSLAYLVVVGLPPLLFYGLDGLPIMGAMDNFLGLAGVFFVLRAVAVISLLGQGLKLASHVVQLAKSSTRSYARAVIVHGLGLFASAGALALGALAIFASVGRSPLKPISSTHSIEYWLGSSPAATIIMALAAIALIALAAPAALELLATAVPEIEEVGATESAEETLVGESVDGTGQAEAETTITRVSEASNTVPLGTSEDPVGLSSETNETALAGDSENTVAGDAADWQDSLINSSTGETGGGVGRLDSGTVTNVSTIDANQANAPFLEKGFYGPYDTNQSVETFSTTQDITLARVSTTENPEGAFLVHPDDIAGMSPEQIQQNLALPKVPTQISNVNVPAGTNMQLGYAARQPVFSGAPGGAPQYQLLDQLPSSNFETPRPLQ
jgi:RsiW-degrading membrane proteinase PrsW (M82 family)